MKKYKSILYLILFSSISLFASQGGNDGSDYMWTDMSGTDTVTTFNWIDVRDGNAFISGTFDNTLSGLINIGFNFSYYGTSYSQVYISTNGFISFTDPGSSVPTNDTIPSASTPDDMIAVFWDNLQNTISTNGGIFYKTVGTAPFQKFIIQWYVINGGSPGLIEFQLILYESSNLIKFQYGQIAAGYNNGNTATVGLQNTSTDGITYSYNDNVILPYSAILWHGEGVSGADATISPTSVNINTLQQFTYTIDNITPIADGLGKIDTAAINIPVAFASSPVVTQIALNGTNVFIQNSTAKPTERGFATWNYNGNAIQVKTTDFEVINSLDVSYYLQTPGTPSTGNDFTSSFGAILDTNAMQSTTEVNYSVDVNAVVDYYTFSPSTDTSLLAGDNLNFIITARDQYGNAIQNSDSVIVSVAGATGVSFSPSDRLGFNGNSTVSFTISKTAKGSFSLNAVKKSDAAVSGASGQITVNPAVVNSISILAGSGSITAGTARTLRVQLLDQYSNPVLADSTVNFTVFSGSGNFGGSPNATDQTNSNGEAETIYTASNTSGANDVVRVSFGGIFQDITMPVVAGTLNEIRIQTVAGDGGAILDDAAITTDDDLVVFAEGYDALGNYKGPVLANWSGSGAVSGHLAPTSSSATTTFSPTTTGTGKITAAFGGLDDISGTITVNAGTTVLVRIMDEPGGTGSPIAIASLMLGQALPVYANGFDSENNFSGNISVTWSVSAPLNSADLTTLTGSGTIYLPQSTGVGHITASSSYPTATTPNFSVDIGVLHHIEIRTAANHAGTVLGDSVYNAGDSQTLWAAGYDLYDNYIADQVVDWQIEKIDGDSIGFLSGSNPATSITFNATVANSGRIKADADSIAAYSGTIKVKSGTATTLTAINPGPFSGKAGGTITDSLGVRLTDDYGNYVQDATILWTTTPTANLNPASDPTNALGVSRSKWTLRNEVSATSDTAYATFGALTPVQFIATVNPSDADQISRVTGDGQTETVRTAVTLPLTVLVEDNLGNPVPGVPVSFIVTSYPSGASNFSLGTPTGTTNGSGQFSTSFTLGDKIGQYVVSASNVNLSGSPVTFTLTAQADVVDHLVMYSGNQQNGTVNTALTNYIFVKAEDQYNNPVQGVAISWTPTSDGSINPLGTNLTNVAGKDSVEWTLRTNAGNDTLTATGTSLNTITYTATVSADAANSIEVVSGDGASTIAGGNQKIVARVIDQYSNPVSGATGVSFSPASRMSALNTVSDANGLVSAIYTTPSGVNSSTAQAILASPSASVNFTVYGIRYVTSSLSPKAVSTGDTVTFSVDVTNPGTNTVAIDTSLSTIEISSDGFSSSAKVASPLVIAASGTTTIQFKSLIVNTNFFSGSYTPVITLFGEGANLGMNGSFNTGTGELGISPLVITQINIPSASDTLSVKRGGDIVTITMSVKNKSAYTLDTFSPDLRFDPDDGYTAVLLPGSPSSIVPNGTGNFSFSVHIPDNATTGIHTVNGSITAELQATSTQVIDTASAIIDYFKVIEDAQISWDSYAPVQITNGQNVTFTAQVSNAGNYDLVLDRDSTTITFGGTSFKLAANNVIEGNGATSSLVFETGTLSVTDGTPGILKISGTEEGNAFTKSFSSDTLGAISNLTVQTQANLAFMANPSLSAGVVSQGQTAESFQFQLSNSGQATAVINSLDDITILVDGADISTTNYQVTLSPGKTFPLNISSGSPELFNFTVNVADDVPASTDVFSVQVDYSDANSAAPLNLASSTNPSWDVLTKTALSITYINAAETQVSQGQTGLNVDVRVVNMGDVQANISDVYLDFKRNTNNFTASIPANIPGNDSTTITFTVAIDSAAATGIDSIRAVAEGTNSYTSAAVSTTSKYLDGWLVSSAGSVSINAVTSTYSRVNRGQQNVPIYVTVTNNGQSTVTVDSVVLNNSPANSTSDILMSALGTLTAGQTRTFNFQSDILGSAANTVILGAKFYGTDNVTGYMVSDLTAAVADTFTVDDPSMLEVESVNASFETFTQGQNNLDVRVNVKNSGTSNVKLDSLHLVLSSIDPNAGNTLGYNQISPTQPNLPTLAPGASSVVLFRLTSSTAVRDSGRVQIDASAYGTDVLSQTFQPDPSADDSVDVVTLQTPANPLATQIFNRPDSVSVGETNITVDMMIENQGSATARVENVALNFFNSLNANANPDYSRDYPVIPAIPFSLGGWHDTTLTFTVGVLDSAELGTINLGAGVQSTELNRNLTIINNNNNLSQWNVLGIGDISILSVDAIRDSVSTGHSNIPVLVTVRNGGPTQVRIDSVLLAFSRGTYTNTFIAPASGNVLAPSTQDTFQVNVGIAAGSASGVSTINANVRGWDLDKGQPINKNGASSGDSWLIQKAVNLFITNNSPTVVSTNQPLSHQLIVKNSGEARLVIDTTNTVLYPNGSPGLSVKLSGSTPLVIEGNQTVTLPFNSISYPSSFTQPMVLNIMGTENSVPLNQLHSTPNQLTVQTPAIMVINSTSSARDSVSQGETLPVTVQISNTGQAGLIVDSITSPEYGALSSVSPSLPYTIPGSGSQSFTGTVDVSTGTSTGDVVLDVSATGRDANSNVAVSDNAATTPDNWFVTTPPDIVISNITSTETLVTQGQSGLLINVTIRNDGETPVNLTNLTLNPTIGLYTIPPASPPGRLDGNDSVIVPVMLDVAANSATGTDRIYAKVNYLNIYSSVASEVTSTAYHEWTIASKPNLDIVSVQTLPTSVSQGQNGVNVQVRLENKGGNSVSINSLDLAFVNGASNYVVGASSPTLPRTISSGLDEIFTLPVDIQALAQTGFDSVSVAVQFISSGDTFNVADSRINDYWQVQSRPAVIISKVEVQPGTVSTGQQGLLGSVYLANTNAANRATARIDSVNIAMELATINRNSEFSINRVVTPVIPFNLAPGATSRIDFNMDVNDDALTGTYSANGYVRSSDINDNTSAVYSGAVSAGNLIVQDSALVVVDTVLVTPDTISQGQTHGRILVKVTNNGSGNAEITRSTLSFLPGVTDMNPVLQQPATPFVLAGGATDSLEYSFVGSQSITAPQVININATLNGEDINSGNIFVVSNINPGLVLIQSPAILSSEGTSPAATSGNENIQFTADIQNSGQADVQLNGSTYLNIGTFNIPLDATSPTVLRGETITTLVFDSTFISGLIPEQNYPLTLHVNGLTNEAAYSKVIDAGSIAYGENLVTITSIHVQGDDIRFQGDTNIEVNMNIYNGADTLSIDDISKTKLYFEDASGITRTVNGLHRVDAITEGKGPLTLTFAFDLQSNFPTGITYIYGILSLENGDVIVDSKDLNRNDSLEVLSPAKVEYAGLTNPVTVVHGQKVSFQMNFSNTGSAGLALNPADSYIEFTEFSPVVRRYLSGSFTISGMSTTTLTFTEITIPENVAYDTQNIHWHMSGQMLNGITPPADESTEFDVFDVLQNAQVAFNPITIEPDQARQGQENVKITYRVQNTGESDAILDNINFAFEKDGAPVATNSWLRTTSVVFPDTIGAGTFNDYDIFFTVQAFADTGTIVPAPVASYRDIRVPQTQKTSSPVISNNDQIEVVTPASVRIDSLFLLASGAPNAPLVNINQNFILAVGLSNTGQTNITSGFVHLKKNGSTVRNIQFLNLAPAESRIIQFTGLSESIRGQQAYTVELSNVLDPENFNVVQAPALDNSETVVVQQARTLSMQPLEITSPDAAKDGTITSGQTFKLQAEVGSSGESAFTSGKLVLTLPANYSVSAADTLERSISSSKLKIIWNITALSASPGDFDLIKVGFKTPLPIDVNTDSPVNITTHQVQLAMTVVASGSIGVGSFVKISPFGSQNTLSTGQQFSVRLNSISFPDNLKEVTATLNLPSGLDFSVVGDASKPVTGSTVDWTVMAPISKTSPIAVFNVTVRGTDENTGNTTATTSGNLILNLRTRAEISLVTNIFEPQGAQDQTVSTRQDVILETRVKNFGEAGIDNSGKIQLFAQGKGQFRDHGGLSNSISIDGFALETTTTYLDTLAIDSIAGMASIYSNIDVIPNDQYSGQPVLIRVDSVGYKFQVIKRADLRLSIDKTGAEDNVLVRATNQTYDFTATVKNYGKADIDTTGGRHYLVLDIDTTATGVKIADGLGLRRPFTLDSAVVWSLTNPVDTSFIGAKVYVDDDFHPFDINDSEANAFINAVAKVDSLSLNVIPVAETVIKASFSTTDSDTSLIVGQNQDSIYVQAVVTFDAQLPDDKYIDLILPPNSGYSLLHGSLRNNVLPSVLQKTVTWLIKAKQNTSSLPDTITIYAQSRKEGTALEKNAEAKLLITTIPKASLTINALIDSPEGAIDGQVSEGQEFRISGVVTTSQGTSVEGTGTVQIQLDSDFFTPVNPSDLEQTFTINEPFFWEIKAKAETPVNLDMDGFIKSLSNQPVTGNIGNNQSTTGKKSIAENRTKSLPNKALKSAFNKKMSKLSRLFAEGLPITVTISDPPNDATLHVPAGYTKQSDQIPVTVIPQATIKIANTAVPDTVSTSQVFDFSVQADQISSNLINAGAAFILPPNLSSTGALDTTQIPINLSTKQAKFSIAVPSNYRGSGLDTLGVYLYGVDKNSNYDAIPSPRSDQPIHIQLRPDITIKAEIIKPVPVNKTAQLSYGQTVQINVWPEFASKSTDLDYAGVTGEGRISLSQSVIDSLGFRLSPGDSISRKFLAGELDRGHPKTWNLIAPQQRLTTNITFTLSELPQDYNSGLNVTATGNSVAPAVNVKPKEIVVTLLDSLLTNNSYIQGDQDIPILAFRISNQEFSDSLYVNALQVTFKSSDDKILSTQILTEIFSRLKIVNYDYILNRGLQKTTGVQSLVPFVDVDVTQSAENPFDLKFNIPDKLIINPYRLDTLLVITDFSVSAKNISFKTELSDLTVFDVADSIKLTLRDEDGNAFLGTSNALAQIMSVNSSDPKENFYSYPNPFGRGDTPEERVAKFNFNLEQPSEVKIQIFTLLGELVWTSKNFPSSYSKGGHKGKITWDGRNGNGNRVLNGTYIGAIEIHPANGTVKRFITKIVYIK